MIDSSVTGVEYVLSVYQPLKSYPDLVGSAGNVPIASPLFTTFSGIPSPPCVSNDTVNSSGPNIPSILLNGTSITGLIPDPVEPLALVLPNVWEFPTILNTLNVFADDAVAIQYPDLADLFV